MTGNGRQSDPPAVRGIRPPLVGVLALQGDFREHADMLRLLGAEAREVRKPSELDGIDGLILPGGESTTIAKLLDAYALRQPIREFAHSGRPVFGTCAGLIMLAATTVEGGLETLGLIDIVARRNAFGRQIHSCEADVDVAVLDGLAVHAVFIRAPWVESRGPGVAVLAQYEGHIVAAEQDNVLVTAFHPELTSDTRMHEYFLARVRAVMVAPVESKDECLQRREGVVS